MPELLSSLLDYTGTLVFFALAGRLGIVQLAGSRIAFSVLLVLFTISMCFGNGLQILSARALGAGDRHRVPLLLRNDGLLAVLVVGLAGVAMAAFPVPFARLFTNDAELIAQTLGALRVVGLTTPVMIWATCATGILRALKRSKWVMYINVLSVWAIELPVAWSSALPRPGSRGPLHRILCLFRRARRVDASVGAPLHGERGAGGESIDPLSAANL